MQRADMIEVAVRGDGHERAAIRAGQERCQRPQARAAVDQQITLGAAKVPDVAPGKRVYVRLPQQHDAVGHFAGLVPRVGCYG